MSEQHCNTSSASTTKHINPPLPSQIDLQPQPENVDSPTMRMQTLDVEEPSQPVFLPALSRRITARLYLSHFLSTWNSRLFEIGAVLFLAAIYPQTLRPMSIYALVRSAVAILLCPALGSCIDKGDRLLVVRISIIGQRFAVGVSCGVFWILLQRKDIQTKVKDGLFVLVVVLACVEKLCSVMNLVAVERDWVVVISQGNRAARQKLNARMRRIDLFCKLLGPLFISLVDGASTIVAIWVTLGMSCVSVLLEYWAIGAVFKRIPTLGRAHQDACFAGENSIQTRSSSTTAKFLSTFRSSVLNIFPIKTLPLYFAHPAFLPSISLSLLYLTVLSFSGQMITFLLAIGYSSTYVGVVRTLSTIFELSATWISPRLQHRIGAIRAGIWFLTWQMLWLGAGISWFFSAGATLPHHHGIFAASGLVGGVISSRVGLWGFDLCAQSIVQEEVDEQSRGAFSTVEAAFQNLFEMLSFLLTIVFPRADQFRWPIVGSVAAVYLAGGVYAAFVRRRRGRLVHIDACFKS